MLDIRPFQSFGLVPYFLEFHTELQRLKHLAAQGPARGALGAAGSDPEYIMERLRSLLETQALLAGRQASNVALDQFREAQYVMAALADDVFLYGLDWRGRDLWRENVLESRLFGTRFAGERIFENIERLLRLQDRRQLELAPIYILALSLGFKGQLRAASDRGVIEDYSRRLFRFAFDRPADPRGAHHVLAPDAYGHVLTGTPHPRRLLRPTWKLAIAGVLLSFLVLSEGLWIGMTSGLDTQVDRVVAASTPNGR